jgi:hypothetical protein
LLISAESRLVASQLSKLSDREESWVQTFLHPLAVKIYGELPLTPELHAAVMPIWDQLTVRLNARELSLPDANDLN